MREVIGKGIRMLCLSVAMAVAGSFALAEPLGTLHEFSDREAPAGHYIVALEENDPATQAALLREVENMRGAVYRKYSSVLNGGFAATLSAKAVHALQRNPYVAFVEPDEAIGTARERVSNVDADRAAGGTDDATYSWGIDRINQRNQPLDGNTSVGGTGAGRTVYILGTGIYYDHDFFEHDGVSVAQPFFDAFGQDGNDCHGLGTHAAGVIHSIAEDAQLRSVRVLNCLGYGSTSGVLAGIDSIIANGQRPAVVYAGLFGWGGHNSTIDMVYENMVSAGIPVIVAAGNENSDACHYSPARASTMITVAGTDISDCRTSFSNYGPCVDIFAPAVDITSAWHTSATATRTLTGTFAAAAHAAGVWALNNSSAYNLSNATTNTICNVGPGSPNLFLYAH